MISAIVTDIEGTTSSIDFVHQTLFPYARRELRSFVEANAHVADVHDQLVAVDAVAGRALSPQERVETLERWIDEDRKATPLKALQGMIWRRGYETGAFTGHVYDDVAPCLRAWHARGLALYVYSSGSEEAQRLLFGHSSAGDLTTMFAGYFDTRIGAKADVGSYRHIRDAIARPAEELLFLSDVGAELDAARDAGLHTVQLVRDARCARAPAHPAASDFEAVDRALSSTFG